MRYRVLPYKQGSRSAKALAEALGGKVLRLEGSTFNPKADDVVINWGRSNIHWADFGYPEVLNHPTLVTVISNKKMFFNHCHELGVSCLPDFYTTKEDIPDEAFPIVCRTVLSGHSGAGIVIASTRAELVEAPLYTRYLKKKDEYRIHVGTTDEGPVLISVQKKARKLECDNPNWQVRNHQNGFIYKREDVTPPACVIQAAYQAFDASGLDFGAVDVIYNDKKGKAYVLEINTAPGLEGQTVVDYADYFRSLSS